MAENYYEEEGEDIEEGGVQYGGLGMWDLEPEENGQENEEGGVEYEGLGVWVEPEENGEDNGEDNEEEGAQYELMRRRRG